MKHGVPRGISVAEALELIGYRFSRLGSREPSLPCRTSGCWAYALVIDGSLEGTCITPVRNGMVISIDVEDRAPLRIVHGPDPHLVGDRTTPWREVNYRDYIEAAI